MKSLRKVSRAYLGGRRQVQNGIKHLYPRAEVLADMQGHQHLQDHLCHGSVHQELLP